MNGIIKNRVINTNKRACPKPAVAQVTVAPVDPVTPVVETPKKKLIKPQSGKSND